MIKQIIFIGIISILLFSCQKDDGEIYTQSAKDVALGERLVSDVLKQILHTTPNFIIDPADTLIDGVHLSSKPELNDSTFPKVITLDYGDGITGSLGKIRKGKILVTINSGTIITEDLAVSFDKYSSDGSEIWGNINYIFNATNTQYSGELLNNGISIVNPNGTMKWDGTFTLTKISTSGTVSLEDDIYEFECTTDGIDFEQTSFTYNTSISHIIDFSCAEYITSGTSILKPNEKGSQTINFGNGNCDANGVIQLNNGSEKNFTF